MQNGQCENLADAKAIESLSMVNQREIGLCKGAEKYKDLSKGKESVFYFSLRSKKVQCAYQLVSHNKNLTFSKLNIPVIVLED